MYPDSNLRTGIARSLSLMLLAASLVSCNLVNPFSSSSASTPALGSVTITASNVSKLVKAWNDTLGGTVQYSTAPTVASGMIYIGATDYRSGSETAMLDALDARTGAKLWSYIAGTKLWNYNLDLTRSPTAPIVANGMVYIASWGSRLDALDAKTGTKLWSYPFGTSDSLTAPTVANGVVYIASEYSLGNGTLDALDAKTGTKLWSYIIGTYSSPTALTVADGVVYIGSANYYEDTSTLEALDAKTGTKLWSYAVGTSSSFTVPTVANGVVYISLENVSGNGMLDALDAKTGTKLWSYPLGMTYSLTTPTVANNVVYIASGNGTLDALDAKTGTKVWNYDIEPVLSFHTPLAVVNRVVYIDSLDFGKLSAFDAKSGKRLWIYFPGGTLASLPIVTNTMVYVNSRKTLYAFAIPIKAPSPTVTASSSNGITTVLRLVPTINKAPVFADVPGLHIQSTGGMQCPFRGDEPSDDLVLTTGRLTYSKDEIRQIRNYLHEMAYGSESLENSYTLTPPPTLHWVSGSTGCSLHLEISNTGNSSVQIKSLGVRFLSAPQPNGSQSLHTIDVCSVADPYDAGGGFGCWGGAGGGGCSVYTLNIALKVAPAASIFAAAPYVEGGGCPEPILHPNDTIVFDMNLSSPGTKQGTVAPYIYAAVPVLTVTDANGSHTFTLSSMAGIATFVNRQQITCYGLLHNQDTTFVPVSTFSHRSIHCLA